MGAICSVVACERPVKTCGLCLTHYVRKLRTGDPGTKPVRKRNFAPTRKTTGQRFWEKVRRSGEDECWIWQATVRGSYGRFWDPERGREVQAHRYSYEMARGPIAQGMEIDHLCHVKLCVNPRHLRQATRRQNQQNVRVSRRSTTGVRGVYQQGSRYRALVGHNGKQHRAGSFATIAEAAAAAEALRAQLHAPIQPTDCQQGDLFGGAAC